MIITVNVDVKSLEESKDIKKLLLKRGVLVERYNPNKELLQRDRRVRRLENICNKYSGKVVKLGTIYTEIGDFHISYKTLQRDIAHLVLEGNAEIVHKGSGPGRTGNYTEVKFK